jgi:hypothetical protein
VHDWRKIPITPIERLCDRLIGPMPELSRRVFWGTVTVVNALGAFLVLLGAESNGGIQVLGYVFLLPGSVIVAVLPLHKLWLPVLWRCCQTDSVGLSNFLYLPLAMSMNLGIWWGLRAYMLRRKARTS